MHLVVTVGIHGRFEIRQREKTKYTGLVHLKQTGISTFDRQANRGIACNLNRAYLQPILNCIQTG